MNKVIAIALLVVGIVLLCLGYNSYHSAASGVSRVLSGSLHGFKTRLINQHRVLFPADGRETPDGGEAPAHGRLGI